MSLIKQNKLISSKKHQIRSGIDTTKKSYALYIYPTSHAYLNKMCHISCYIILHYFQPIIDTLFLEITGKGQSKNYC